jgi:K+-transporting ATPase A subunit
MLLIFLIGAALTNTFGRMVGDERQGWSLFGAMMVLFAVGLCVIYSAETSGNPHYRQGVPRGAVGSPGFSSTRRSWPVSMS